MLIVFQIVIPLILIGRVAIGGQRSRYALLLDIALAGVYLVAVAVATPLLVIPWYFPALLGVLLGGAAVAALRRARRVPVRPDVWVPHGVRMVIRTLAVAGTAGMVILALRGRRPLPGPPVELAFPLREGVYLVANGGSNTTLNAHLVTLRRERARAYRGQSYALDLVKVGAWGSRRAGPFAASPESFAIFGDTVHAPCSGTVVRATDGEPDWLAPGGRPASLEGNHVILECGNVWVLLAHMRQGSVMSVAGDAIASGQPLGLVGNSGNSDEPHLHIHAQRPGIGDSPLGGEPLPMTFGGRQVVRNQRIDTR